MAYLLSGERSSAARSPFRARPFAWLSTLATRWEKHRRRRAQRIALATLLQLDDARLEDLGISRYDVIEAVRDHLCQSDSGLSARRAERAEAWLRSGRPQP